MSQKSLVLNLILSGKIDSDFYKLGSELSLMGELIDQIGGKVREYEKNSLETYKNYETYMLEAKGALTAQYESQSELERVMTKLDAHAQQWAADTIFDTRDVSKAISEAAHAGWTYEEMAEGIPQAMLLAQAGNISLADGLNYVIKALNATGTEFEDGSIFIDQWVKAANSGATTVDQLGEAIIRMGGTSQFTDSTAEMFTMLAVLADIGVVGPDAGTALRNSMLRLVAPTDKAATMMDLLSVSTEEYYALAADEATLKKANELLTQTGFSAYDSYGNLKPFLETYKDLYSAVSGMSEVDKNAVLSAIFPTRTLGSALGILEAAANNYDNLYEKILGSEGYAEKIAQIQTSGLMGAEENFEGKTEEFSRKIGETLAPIKEDVLGLFGGFIDGLNELPEEQLSALTGAMSALSIVGPASMGIGGAIKLISALGKTGITVTLAAVALGTFVSYATKLSELDLESTFGNLELDIEKLGDYVDQIETKFDIENSAVAQYAAALATAQENYVTLSTTLEENLLAASLTGHVLTDEEKANIISLGDSIGKAMLDGIEAARDESLSFLDILFGDAEAGSDEAKALENLAGWTNSWADDLNAEAYEIGAQLRSQMVAALTDGKINETEQAAIDASLDRLDQIMAEIQAGVDREAYLKELHKARSISWESLEGYLGYLDEKREAELAEKEEAQHTAWARYRRAWESKYAKAETDEQRQALITEWDDTEVLLKGKANEAKQSVIEVYEGLAYEAWSNAMRGSDHGQAFAFLEAIWKDADVQRGTSGMFDFGDVDLSEYLPQGVSAQEMIDQLFDLYSAEDTPLVPGFNNQFTKITEPIAGDNLSNMLDSSYDAAIKLRYDTSEIETGLEGEMPEVEAVVAGDTTELESAISEQDGTNLIANVDGDTEALAEAIDEQDGQNLTAYVDGDTTELEAAIEALDGTSITVKVKGSGLSSLGSSSSSKSSSSGSSSSSSSSGRWISSLYAEGGRATEASIFGEAGPEWAIPEEHSERTASLLDQARQASGFTWGDLISRNGGLNGTPGSKTVNLTYAPTINAGNADGVERVLADDKSRLMAMIRSMMAEINMRDDAEVYA